MEPRWTRWGADRQTPAPAAGNIIAAPSIEQLMPIQPLAAVLSTQGLQRRSRSQAASASAPSLGGGAGRIFGTAVQFDKPYAVGSFLEVCKRGAFNQSLATDDARLLFDANSGLVLGRQTAGTLRVWESSEGLEFECDAPETQWASDLLVSMRRHDIDGSGVTFYVGEHHWEQRGNDRVRVVQKARLVFLTVDSFAVAGSAGVDAAEQVTNAQRVGFAQGKLAGEANMAFRLEAAKQLGYKRGLLSSGTRRKRVGRTRQGASK